MRRLPSAAFLTFSALAWAALAAGCAGLQRAVPRVDRLGDGVFKSPTAEEAETYCRNFGAPTRFIDPVKPLPTTASVTYRCD
jgi:hypothetical protein